MEYISPDAERELQAKQLRQIIGTDPSSVDIDPEELKRGTGHHGLYGELAMSMLSDFITQAIATGDDELVDLADNKTTISGFYVVAKLLSYGPQAYLEYSEQSGEEPSVERLAEIMRNSSDVIRVFAGMNIARNAVYEQVFGLARFVKEQPDEKPFSIVKDNDDKLKFVASPVPLAKAADLSWGLFLFDPQELDDPNAKCPALGLVLNTLWYKAIDGCVNDPRLFAADLGMSPMSVKPE